ncbi:MAG: FAD-dependent monooxygenase [Xanthomonadales bacterium]|nr:FAD-dependent monooxygenase [Xanthomonadales bacterium]
MTSPCSVLIVGAGPVGLTAALCLSRAGVPVRIVDAGDDVDRRMRASTFHPPTLDMLAELELAEPLIDLGLRVPRWQLRQHETKQHLVFDLAAIAADTRHPYRLQVEQHRYCDLAVEALARSGVTVEFGKAVSGVEQTSDRTTAALDSGGESIEAQWVIGADGAASPVRKSLGLKYGGMTHTHSSVLVSTTFPFHEALEDLSDVSYCWSRRGPYSLLRLRQLWRVSLYPGTEDLAVAAEEDRVRDWLNYIHPEAGHAELLDVHPYRVHERCVDQFRVGRVFLAGDAAHLNPPSGGMGMNGGIHDAVNLTGKLIEVMAGASDSLLDRYQRQRHQIVSGRIIPQASANRARMAVKDPKRQLARLDEHRQIAADGERCREFLLKSSMISGLREAEAIE